MLEPMHPSLEESPAADTASGRRAAATGRPPGRESPDDIEFNIDELIIKSDKVQLLQENVDRIEENFHVTVGLGMSATEDTHQMQWITIQGIPEDRAQAKSYIKALCSPGKDLAFNFPDELHQTLTHPNVLDRLEKQSCTAILFPSCGQAVIQGEDDLAVALAMSAIEDIIQKYGDVNILDVSSPNSSAGEVSGRLDRELRRLSNQNKELYGEEYDMETLTSLPGPVKRTILKQYIDDSRQNSIEEQPKSDAVTTYSRDPEQTIPMRLVGSSSSSAFSESRFVDLHPTSEPTDNDTRQRKPQTEVDLHPMAASSHNNSSLTLSLSLKDNRDAHAFIDLTAEPSTPVVSVGSPNASTTLVGSPVVDLTQQTSTLAESAGTLSLIGEAIKFALNSGYTKQEIEEVQNVYGDILTTAQFLQVLHTNRREKTQKHAVTVSDLEATHVPRPPQDRCAEVAAIAETVTTDSSRSEEELERPVTPSGKQQAYKTHNQGPKMKRGKLSKTPVKQTGKKAQSRKNRRSPSEETAEKMEVVSLTDQTDDPGAKAPSGTHSNAVHNMLQNSPHSRTKKNSGLKEGDSIVLMDYLKLLTQDYDEEDSSDIEEVRKRNTARRKLLKQALELEKKRHHEQQSRDDDGNKLEAKDETDAVENDVLELDGEDWNTASRDGRHRFPRSPVGSPGSGMERGAIGGDAPDGGTKPKKTDVVTIPDISDNVVPRSLDRGGGASRVYPVEEEHVVQLDALDDFSLPPVINVDTADGLINSRAPQRGACINNNSAQHRQTRFSNPNDQRNPAYSQIRPPQKYNHQPQPLLPTPQPRMSTQPAPLMQQHTAATGRTYDEGSKLASKSNLRYIVLDGSNIAMTHGNHQIFSCKGIQICIEYFRRRGHTEITAFVPQWRTHAPRPDYPIRDQHLLEELRKEGVLVFTPARRVPGKNIVCYDDKFVLRLAQETDGVIISNDNYRDLWHEKREWRQIIEDRLLMFSFVGNIFMPPDDPLGRNGPQLDEFLRKSIPDQCIRDQQQQKRQQYDNEKNLYNRPNHTNQGQGSWAIWGRPSQYQGRSIQGQAAWNQKPVTAHNFNQGYPGQSQNNQAQGHFPQNTQGQGQGHFPHNPQGQGQGNFNQNSGGGPRPRPDSATDWLKKKLFVIFSDKEAKIDEMLQRYPTETDINRIIEYMLEDN